MSVCVMCVYVCKCGCICVFVRVYVCRCVKRELVGGCFLGIYQVSRTRGPPDVIAIDCDRLF